MKHKASSWYQYNARGKSIKLFIEVSSCLICVEYLTFDYVDAARQKNTRYPDMPCIYIRHSFVRFYIFTLHIIQLKVVVVQPYVIYVSRMLHCTLYSSGYNSLRIGPFLLGCWFFGNHTKIINPVIFYLSKWLSRYYCIIQSSS